MLKSLKPIFAAVLCAVAFLRPAAAATLTYADGVTQIFNPNATLAGMNVGSHAGDPSSLNNGDLWYSTSTNTLRARVNGSTISLANASHTHSISDVTGLQTALDAKAASGLVRVVSDTGATTVYNPAADTDEARGTALYNACAAATAGQTVYVSAAAYELVGIYAKLTLADNVNLTMEDGAVITSPADLQTEGCVIYPGNNSVIRGGKVICEGAPSNFAAAVGVVGDLGETQRTGVQVIGMTMVGDTDCFYIQEDAGNCSAVLRDCVLISKWDNIVASAAGSGPVHRVDVYNCRQIITGPSATASNQARGVMATFDSIIRVFGGSIECTDGGTSINAGIYAKDGGTVEVYDVAIRCSNGMNPNYDLQIGTGGGTIKVSGGTGSGTAGGYLTTGTITYMDGKVGSLTGLLKANGSGVLSAAAAGTDYLAPDGNGSGLTALNASNLGSGTIPDARFPATLPAANGAALTALNAGNISSGTLPVARGGTGVTDVFAMRRQIGLSAVRFPQSLWVPASISGSITSGTESTNGYPFVQIAAATAGKARMYVNISGGGPVWPGQSPGQADFARKCVVNLACVAQLSAHTDSRISIHFNHSSVATHSSFDRSVEGISMCFQGGASEGTVWVQTHDGTTTANSSTAAFAINDLTGYSWTLEWEPGVGARLYKGGVLQCTGTSNLPSGLGATSSAGIVIVAENTTNGTGNMTFLRWLDCYFTELP